MAIAPNPNVIMAELRYSWDSQEVENVLFFDVGAPAGTAACKALADELALWWAAWVQGLQSTTVTLREVYCRAMVIAGGPEATSTLGLPDVGTESSPSQPNNVTCAISFRTGLAGRSYRGRNYIIGLCENQVLQNTLNALVAVLWTDAYLALLPGGGSVTEGEWCVYSQYSGGELRTTGLAIPINTALFVNTIVDSQRRRLPGRGQ